MVARDFVGTTTIIDRHDLGDKIMMGFIINQHTSTSDVVVPSDSVHEKRMLKFFWNVLEILVCGGGDVHKSDPRASVYHTCLRTSCSKEFGVMNPHHDLICPTVASKSQTQETGRAGTE